MNKALKICLLTAFTAALTQFTSSAATELTGTVKSLNVVDRSINYDAAYEGEFGESVSLGTIGLPNITRLNSDEVLEGDALYSFKLPYWESMVEGYKYLTKSSKVQADNAKIQLSRYDKLVKPGAVSEQEREGYIGKYIDSINNYYVNKAMIQNKYENVREAVFRPPFEGIVTKIYQTTGLATGGKVMQFTQLNPIGIDVIMDRSEARKLAGKPVKIIPAIVDKPQGIFYGLTVLTDTGVTFITANEPTSTLQNKNFEYRVHRNCGHVTAFYVSANNSSSNIGVPKSSIQKIDNDYYVWIASGVKDLSLNDGLDKILTIKKVKVVPEDLFRKTAATGEIQKLKDSGELQIDNIVLRNPPNDLKDGEKIFFPSNRYVLMPGEQVKVIIGN